MIPIPIDEVPLMETTDIINGECVAFMIDPEGVLVHYLEKDYARLITWEDIVGLGMEKVDKPGVSGAERPDDGIREIGRPVMP